ncbi:hypothetical protein LLH23_06210 [bacterium]|nr:hypothetical protein [bacterium]
MNLFDKAREALGQAAAAVSSGAEQLSLQAQLGNLESELERQLVEVGKRARELRQQGAFVDGQIDVLLRRVVQIEEQMEELRKQALTGQAPAATPPAPPPPPSSGAPS